MKAFPLLLQTISNEPAWASSTACSGGHSKPFAQLSKGSLELPSDTTLGLIQGSCSKGQSGKQIKHIILGQQSCGNSVLWLGFHQIHSGFSFNRTRILPKHCWNHTPEFSLHQCLLPSIPTEIISSKSIRVSFSVKEGVFLVWLTHSCGKPEQSLCSQGRWVTSHHPHCCWGTWNIPPWICL